MSKALIFLEGKRNFMIPVWKKQRSFGLTDFAVMILVPGE
jgi:hypothetical protein